MDLLKKGNEVVITTVGRLCEQKGQDRIIIILDELLKLGYNIRWFLVGDGDLREKLEIEIKNKKLEENLILLGTKLNPYPYIKNCDIYVQPSRSEGYCLTLAEAKILEKPIVVTEFAGSFEQIENQINGIRVKNQNKDILDGIIYLLENENIKIELEENLKKSNLNLAVKDNNIRNLI
ncbi:glycosyltransferase [Fusobacterium mortiferum]|uniref:glycosyltransferase n=1 Tax=Fusobacterium mortiferum TaxID=850 RepID=UPI0030B908E6